jgi:enoyl-CoA hydratase
MSEYKNLLVATKDDITTVTINRPDALNALDNRTLAELGDVVAKLATNTEVRAVIITGAGDKAFVAGADLAAMSTMTAEEGRDFSVLGHTVFDAIENLPQVVIAAINGYALGGGCELAMACDIRIASENAKFGQPEVTYGIIPGFGGTQRLARLVGKGIAKQYIYTGAMFGAEEAYRIGLVNVVTKPEELIPTAEAMMGKILKKSPLAIRSAKDAINKGFEMTLEQGMYYEAQAFAVCFATKDQKEGMAAFLEKRKPNFKK